MSDSPIARDHLDGDYRNSKDMIIHARGVVYDLLSLNIDGFSDESDISAEEDMQLNFERLTPMLITVPMVGTTFNLTTLIMGKF